MATLSLWAVKRLPHRLSVRDTLRFLMCLSKSPNVYVEFTRCGINILYNSLPLHQGSLFGHHLPKCTRVHFRRGSYNLVQPSTKKTIPEKPFINPNITFDLHLTCAKYIRQFGNHIIL